AKGLRGTSGPIQPQDHMEKEQPPAKPTPSSPQPSTTSVQREARGKPGAEVFPPGSLGIPAGRAALLRQEAVASREDSGLPLGEESPDKVLEKGSSQADSLGPGGSQGTAGARDAAGKAGSGQGEVCPGETREDSSTATGTCPEERSEDRSPGKDGGEGDLQRPWEEPGMGKPPAKSAELPGAAPEQVEGRRAEVCPWETREQGKTVRAEICPWDTEGAQLERERQEGEKRSIRPTSLGRGSPKSRESVEQPGMGLPKPSSQQAGSVDSKKATICPWEVEDEPRPKTEICPWEEAAAPAGKEGLRQDTSKREGKPGSRGMEDSKAKLAEMGGRQAQRR
ncbi:GP179 protein, partial [Tachuris rubrigastra]|nr:GP179 protein [Tachuris rubrigastra]